MGDTVIKVEGVSKKFCRRLRQSVLYGTQDVARGMLGLESRTGYLRPGEFWAVKDASFELKRGETLGLIGPNGSGKSTLLRLLNGIYQPDTGRIEIRGRVGALIAVGAGFHPLMTGRENIYLNGAILGMSRDEIKRKFESIVDFADIGDFLDSPVKTYSSGMYVRLGFAVAIHCEPDILLVDEVLAVGDVNFQRKCFDRIGELRKAGTSIVIVTHSMHHLSTMARRALLLDSGRILIDGEVDAAIEMYNDVPGGVDVGKGIERVVSSTEKLLITDVLFDPPETLSPGETLQIRIGYEAREDIPDLEVDIGIYRDGCSGLYFQGTSRSAGYFFDIPAGRGILEISLENIPINKGMARLAVALWEKERASLLFWWRNIPLKFKMIKGCTGENYIKTTYDIHAKGNN